MVSPFGLSRILLVGGGLCEGKLGVALESLQGLRDLTTAPPDLECGVAPLSPPAPAQLPLLGHGCHSVIRFAVRSRGSVGATEVFLCV